MNFFRRRFFGGPAQFQRVNPIQIHDLSTSLTVFLMTDWLPFVTVQLLNDEVWASKRIVSENG